MEISRNHVSKIISDREWLKKLVFGKCCVCVCVCVCFTLSYLITTSISFLSFVKETKLDAN